MVVMLCRWCVCGAREGHLLAIGSLDDVNGSFVSPFVYRTCSTYCTVHIIINLGSTSSSLLSSFLVVFEKVKVTRTKA